MNFVKFDNRSADRWFTSIPLVGNEKSLYVLDWYAVNDKYYAIGIDIHYKLAKMLVKEISSGLYVWALDEKILKNLLCNITQKQSITLCNENTYYNNNVSVFDSMIDEKRYNKNWKMFKISTNSFEESKSLYYKISNNKGLSHHICTLGQWHLSMFLMMEMHVRNKDFIYCIHINDVLEYVPDFCDMKKIPKVIFDIETISNHDHRLPMGNFIADCIMSVTLVIDCELVTLFNLPLNNDEDMKKTKELITQVDSSTYYKVKHRTNYVYNSESDLLNKFFQLLDDIDNPYICLGYNSRGYDMPFLLSRSVFLNLPQANNFYYMNGILSYGKNMLHIDIMQTIIKFFAQELTSFSLKNVAKILLEDDEDTQKVDFNARNLRYIYKYISDHNNINEGTFDSVLCQQSHTQWNVDIGTLAKYNEMDCLVVLALFDKLQYCSFLPYTSKKFFLPFTRSTLSKLSEYLSGNMIYVGLQQQTVFSKHHEQQIIKNSKFIFTINNDILASSNDENVNSFGGGFNFRLCKGAYDTVHAMDAQAYYPELISGTNISHETTALILFRDLLNLSKLCKTINFDNYTFIKFCTHKSMCFEQSSKSIAKIDQSVTPFAYINHIRNNCPQMNFKEMCEMCDLDDKIVVVAKTKKGILSNIIELRNTLRNIAKENKKAVRSHIMNTENIQSDYKFGLITDDSGGDDDFADDFADEDEIMVVDKKKEFDISEYYVKKSKNQTEEEYLVSTQIELISKEEFAKYENPQDVIDKYLVYLSEEFVRLNSHYRNMKLLNNAVYGLLGSSYGTLKSKNVAAIVTMLGRMNIVKAAQIGNRINGSTIYSDTDSVYFDLSHATVPNPQKVIVNSVSMQNSHVMLNVKIYRNVFVLGRKTYIGMSGDSIFSRGINKNGPALWKVMMDRIYCKYIVDKESLTCDGVSSLLFDIYMDTYNYVLKDKTQVLRLIGVQNREEYKKEIPVTKLMDRIAKEMPTYVFGNKINCFYKRIGDISDIHYALDFELAETDVKDINLYKFYSNISMTFYSIISYAIERTAMNTQNILIKYSNLDYKKIEKITYLKFLSVIDSK
ncbi:DNA polymerase [Carcinus maenas nudivirus]|uniref:DNA-directed DNA polymerase n=1 Tax=Carcinus maenas nudivirus TaxID=2880837 RepID=A0AAE8Y0Q7_9VIRU|nr:DNA polymerase [Carcinus maenas nudivirus]UBZ25591.1 DNA polymerase [Carcinus maenas nudivirus]